jgi:hypothetical protein
MLFSVMPSKPRSRAIASRSCGKPLPASAPDVAREHFEIRQQIVRPQHRLRAPQMRIPWHNGVRMLLRQIEDRGHQCPQQIGRAIALSAQPQPRIERHLLIAAAARVDFVRQRADAFFQLADDEAVDILSLRAPAFKKAGSR